MSSVIILGSSSFLGRVLLNNINSSILFKAIVRKIPVDADRYDKRVKWIKLDNINFSSLINIFEKEDVVINLTYVKNNNRNANINLINDIVDACIYSKISRLIHCSTASVVGDNKINNINELQYVRSLLKSNILVQNLTLKSIELNNNLYTILFVGDIENFKNSLELSRLNLFYQNDLCNIKLV